jgi:hypothetical protein
MLGYNDLVWRGGELFRRDGGKALLKIVPDSQYSAMWRVVLPSGELSGMLNRTRTQDCGRAVALRKLNAA